VPTPTRTQYSRHLRRQMRYRVYGDRGKPVVAFPTSEAHFFQWEDFGMVHALEPYIDGGIIQLWTVDAIDEETFFRPKINWGAAMRRHEQYFSYLRKEFLPMVADPANRKSNWDIDGGLMLTGCSMGAYHASNLFFRYPKGIDSVIALSGVYSPRPFTKGVMTRSLLANSPLDYLPGRIDRSHQQAYQAARLVFCAGQGAGEEEMLADTVALARILMAKHIPAWIDLWGKDVTHDWPWWRQQLPYFLHHYLEDKGYFKNKGAADAYRIPQGLQSLSQPRHGVQSLRPSR